MAETATPLCLYPTITRDLPGQNLILISYFLVVSREIPGVPYVGWCYLLAVEVRCCPTSTTNFHYQLPLPTSTTNFHYQLPLPTSTTNFHYQLPLPVST